VVAVADDHVVVVPRLARRERHPPTAVVETLALGDRGVERDRLPQTEVVHVVVEVLQDLGMVGKVGPIVRNRVVLERQAPLRGVDVQAPVARRHPVGIAEVPVPTDVVRHLEAVVRQAVVLQPLGHGETRTAGPDDAGDRSGVLVGHRQPPRIDVSTASTVA
jgi:hypothetical protein